MVAEGNRPFNPEEIRRFYEEHEFWLREVIRKVAGSNQDVEDILQIFLLRLMEKPVPKAAIKERGYCYKMLKNSVIDINRSAKTYDKYINDFAQTQPIIMSQDPFGVAAKTDEFRYVLKKATEYLPARIVLALQLRLIKGYTNADVAKKLSVKKKTSTKYITDGKNMLRKIFNKGMNFLIFLCA